MLGVLNQKIINLFNFSVPYRDCDVVKNLKDPADTYLKTICSVQLSTSYLTAEALCIKDRMKLAVINSPVLETAVVNFTNTKYAYRSGGAYIQGNFGATCTLVSNLLRSLNDYRIANTTCTSLHYSYCEYIKPQG